MLVFHIGHHQYAKELSGKGAELYGGRWNQPGTPCIYTASSRALSILEYAANVKLDYLPANLAMTTYQLPDACFKEFAIKDLPANWRDRPAPVETAVFGSRLLQKAECLALRMPSVIIPEEHNLILNPLHRDFSKIKILRVEAFTSIRESSNNLI